MKRSVVVLPLLLTAVGCSSGRQAASSSSDLVVGASPSTAAPTVHIPTPKPPHFATPEEAMRYLATAWNDRNTVALRHVTNPSAREQLDAMHSEAVNLRLTSCALQPAGDYQCTFSHDYPAEYAHPASEKHGEAVFLVGPALTPGWYMTVFQHCG
jgi:hypothetical protein